MKILAIIIALLLIVFLIVQFFAMRSQNSIETYPYEVVKRYDQFEIRNYEASLFSAVTLSTNNYREGASKGFSILASYIFGGNDKNEKIAMTSPVAMSLEDSMKVMFMVPKRYDKSSLPRPDQSDINFEEVPARTVAAITFGGWASDKKITSYKNQLTSALEAENIPYKNQFYFLGYNPPYEVLNRKNEIIVELE